MSPMMIRRFWSLVDTIRWSIPVSLDDTTLEQWLLRKLRSEQVLDHHQAVILSDYIHTRLPLIRELAQEA